MLKGEASSVLRPVRYEDLSIFARFVEIVREIPTV